MRPRDRFQTACGELHGRESIVLSDLTAETQAQIVPSMGFSCLSFRVATSDGEWPVLAEPPDEESLLTRTSRYGIPIMYPWPNRIRDGVFRFGGRSYRMPLAPNGPHAIHGVVRGRPWTVESQGADSAGAFCRARIEIGVDEDDVWPFPSRLTVEYRLDGRELFVIAEAVNTGDTPMPLGFGIHPWFGMPLGPRGS